VKDKIAVDSNQRNEPNAICIEVQSLIFLVWIQILSWGRCFWFLFSLFFYHLIVLGLRWKRNFLDI